jgi:hypothetical protein
LYSLGVTFGFILTGCTGTVLRTEEEIKQLSELSEDQKQLVCGLIRAEPQSRTALDAVLKNPFIRGDFGCVICYDRMMVQEVLLCHPNKHPVCHLQRDETRSCFERNMNSLISKPPEFLEKSAGEIACPVGDCKEGHFPFEYIAKNVNAAVMADYFEVQKRFTEAIARRNEREKLMKQNEEVRRQDMEINQKLQEALIEGRQNSRKQMLDYLMTEKAMEADEYTRRCPSCERVVQKLGGCSLMRCGENYHGGDQQQGCGTSFDFNNAPRYKSTVKNLDQLIRELSREHLRRRDLG